MNRILKTNVLDDYKIQLEFSDGSAGIVDLSEYAGKGVFSFWDDYSVFRQVKIGSSGELIWGEQADLCPDALYIKMKNSRPEDLFPNLRRESLHA